jgi:valyl-tRNA synthetase
MEMISEWRTLKQQVSDKPHEQVDLFVQANKDIQLLVEEHFDLVHDILRVGDIQYINENEETSDDYQIAMIMDIKVGAKGIKVRDWKETLVDLEKQVANEEQFLQRLRMTLASNDFSAKAPEKVVKAKKKKMKEVKTRIAQLELEIQKIKVEKK